LFKIRKVKNGFILTIRNYMEEEMIFSDFDEMIKWIKFMYSWWVKVE